MFQFFDRRMFLGRAENRHVGAGRIAGLQEGRSNAVAQWQT